MLHSRNQDVCEQTNVPAKLEEGPPLPRLQLYPIEDFGCLRHFEAWLNFSYSNPYLKLLLSIFISLIEETKQQVHQQKWTSCAVSCDRNYQAP